MSYPSSSIHIHVETGYVPSSVTYHQPVESCFQPVSTENHSPFCLINDTPANAVMEDNTDKPATKPAIANPLRFITLLPPYSLDFNDYKMLL